MKNKSMILGIAIIVVVVIISTGCVFYNLLKPEDFKNKFTSLGFKIVDTNVGDYDSKTYLEAIKDNVPYRVSYYEFASESEAQKIYQKYKRSIGNYITSDSDNTEKKGAVFSKIVAKSEKEYIVISRVKNTLIFIAATNEYANEINEFLDNIKY